MNIFVKITAILGLFVSCVACSMPLGYGLEGINRYNNSPYGTATLAVKEFTDKRPRLDTGYPCSSAAGAPQICMSRNGKFWYYNRDDRYPGKKNSPLITLVIVDHLCATNLFKSVVRYSEGNGADYVLEGDVSEFLSRVETLDTVGGTIGIVTSAVTNTEFDATTSFSSVRLIQANTGKVVWSGNVSARLTGEESGVKLYDKANKSLKQAVSRLAAYIASSQK